MKYIKKILLIYAVFLLIPKTSYSAAVVDEDLTPPKLTRQKADGVLRLTVDPVDVHTNPEIGNTIGTIHIIDDGRNIEVERFSEHLLRISDNFFYVNAENRILEAYYFRGIDLNNYLRLLLTI